MCSFSDNPSEINDGNDRIKRLGLRELESTEQCGTSQGLVLEDNELCEIDNVLCEAFQTKTPIIPRHREHLLNRTSSYLEDTLAVTKIADVINIETAGSVHVGHVINITEQIVLNANNNELEFNAEKKKDYTNHFNIVDRMHWLAQPSVAEIELMKRPAKYVIICHTATEEAYTQAENVLMLRLLQTFHIESRGWADIGYNFCIGSDGNVYEGRGWFKVGCHTVTYNRYSIGIAFIGCFLNNLPPKSALKRCQDLIAHGVEIGAISPDYELVAHCQCRPFVSPGNRLFEEIKTWKNFNPDIVNTDLCILDTSDREVC